jgi:hypothetical protein
MGDTTFRRVGISSITWVASQEIEHFYFRLKGLDLPKITFTDNADQGSGIRLATDIFSDNGKLLSLKPYLFERPNLFTFYLDTSKLLVSKIIKKCLTTHLIYFRNDVLSFPHINTLFRSRFLLGKPKGNIRIDTHLLTQLINMFYRQEKQSFDFLRDEKYTLWLNLMLDRCFLINNGCKVCNHALTRIIRCEEDTLVTAYDIFPANQEYGEFSKPCDLKTEGLLEGKLTVWPNDHYDNPILNYYEYSRAAGPDYLVYYHVMQQEHSHYHVSHNYAHWTVWGIKQRFTSLEMSIWTLARDITVNRNKSCGIWRTRHAFDIPMPPAAIISSLSESTVFAYIYLVLFMGFGFCIQYDTTYLSSSVFYDIMIDFITYNVDRDFLIFIYTILCTRNKVPYNVDFLTHYMEQANLNAMPDGICVVWMNPVGLDVGFAFRNNTLENMKHELNNFSDLDYEEYLVRKKEKCALLEKVHNHWCLHWKLRSGRDEKDIDVGEMKKQSRDCEICKNWYDDNRCWKKMKTKGSFNDNFLYNEKNEDEIIKELSNLTF